MTKKHCVSKDKGSLIWPVQIFKTYETCLGYITHHSSGDKYEENSKETLVANCCKQSALMLHQPVCEPMLVLVRQEGRQRGGGGSD